MILTVKSNGIVYYELNKDNTNEEVFLNYTQKMKAEIEKQQIKQYLIVMDNLSVHKTKKVLELYLNNKLKVLFNTSYLSPFKAVELAFRNMKLFLYAKNFKDIEEINQVVINILTSER